MFEAIRFPRSQDADFMVGGRTYGVFAHDWRIDPLPGWIEVKTALDPRALDTDGSQSPPRVEVLSEPDFESALRQALRDLRQHDALARNPLHSLTAGAHGRRSRRGAPRFDRRRCA